MQMHMPIHMPMRIGTCMSRAKIESNKKSKKLRRSVSWDIRPSTIRLALESAKQVEQQEDVTGGGNSSSSSNISNSKDAKSCTNVINEIWYSKEEYKQILIEQSLTVYIMRSLRTLLAQSANTSTTVSLNDGKSNTANGNGNNSDSGFELMKKANSMIDPDEYCERGFESYQSEELQIQIYTNRKLHTSLVIGEQTRQWINEVKDPELIRNSSMVLSVLSSLKAQLLAVIDKEEVQTNSKYNNNNNNSSSSSSKSKSNSGKQQQQQPPILQKVQEYNINSCIMKGMMTPSLESTDLSRFHHHDNKEIIYPLLSGSNNELRNQLNHGAAVAKSTGKNYDRVAVAVAATTTTTTTSLDTAFDTDRKKRPRSNDTNIYMFDHQQSQSLSTDWQP